MHFLTLALLDAPRIAFPAGTTPHIQLLLRWVHFIGGITWVGLLYFLMLVNVPFLKEIDSATRSKVVPLLMPRALWWFRWASVVTVFAGIWYWMMIVSADAHNAQTSGGGPIGTFFGIWTLAFVVEMGVVMSPLEVLRKGPVFGVIVGIIVVAAAWLYLMLNSRGWESNRLLAIGIGGGLGWFMMLNVWGIVWRMQKKIIRWTAENASKGIPMPPETAKTAQLALLVSQANFVLTFPMLLMMAVASHYPVFGP
ncbi:MAG TPA: urate hydroxylase PuuD [Candidatus Angelobacter sp.]|nr:urate hydroxylase PuuD [Candidatus Angelobacter sp.]